MCGILSILWPNVATLRAALRAGLEAMRHRGPDGSGVWVDPTGTVGLGHVRLAVIDPLSGAQPIASEDAAVVAVVNGEFYDFERIRGELEWRGHRFATGSDSEVLVHLYEERGVACLEELRGEFAFVLWDSRRRRLFAARDRFGIKPLCFASTATGLYLASEAKALFAAGVRARWSAEAFLHAAHHQYLPPDLTLFEGVAQLRPGHFLLASAGEVRTQAYWDIDFPMLSEPAKIDAQPAIERLRELLDEAVSLRLRADVPVACALSGGLDSSAIVALAARRARRPVACFGVSFEASAYDERGFAEQVAAHVGAEFHAVEVSQRDLVENLEQAVYFSEGLAINGHLSAKFLLSKAIAAAGFKVVLTGEGADEALAGYAHFRQDLAAWTHRGDEAEQARLQAALVKANAASGGVMLADASAGVSEAVRRRLGVVPSFLQAKAQMGARITAMLSAEFCERAAGVDYIGALIEAFDVEGRLKGRHPVDQAAYLWSRLALANYILRTLGDGTEMAHSVEGRTPFLDHRLFEFCQQLPLALKINHGVEKWVLRRAVEDLLPETVVARPKHPFLAPPLCIHSNAETDALIQDTLRSDSARALPFFDRTKLLALLDALGTMTQAERQAAEPVLMTALSASMLQTSLKLETTL
ncbi:MAG: asparagine synthase (glutamine-hydrolyzing) [Bradymonadaceae bacterium]|nr:asparagine synthase (glutamine-hydrolyzing) [Lujinxingiaceae bacterium]